MALDLQHVLLVRCPHSTLCVLIAQPLSVASRGGSGSTTTCLCDQHDGTYHYLISKELPLLRFVVVVTHHVS